MTTQLKCSPRPFLRAVSELEFYVRELPQLALDFAEAFDELMAHPARFYVGASDVRGAVGTRKTWVFLKPSERFIELLTAVRARAAEQGIAYVRTQGHGRPPLGQFGISDKQGTTGAPPTNSNSSNERET